MQMNHWTTSGLLLTGMQIKKRCTLCESQPTATTEMELYLTTGEQICGRYVPHMFSIKKLVQDAFKFSFCSPVQHDGGKQAPGEDRDKT